MSATRNLRIVRRTFVSQEPVHVLDIPQILFPSRLFADGLLPLVYHVEDTCHDRTRERRGPLGKASYELIQELFGRDLEVEEMAERVDERLEEVERED